MKKLAYVIVGVFVLSLIAMVPTAVAVDAKPVFKYGVSGAPKTLDPAHAWDSASIDIIDQVCEGLVAYDLYDPELAIIPSLATDLGTWNTAATEVTFTLRQGVTFHDGSKFNATSVKYTFDRLNNLIMNGQSQLGELYEPLLQLYEDTPLVINETEVLSEYSVKFHLNYPYVAFTPLLCFSGSYIVHKDMPFNTRISLNDTLFGTGPYVLESYTPTETHFTAYENYWRPQPEIQEMIWIKFADSVTLAQAFLVGDIDMPDSTHPDYITQYEATPSTIHVDPPKAGTCIYYMGINNEMINKTYRQAISHAIDYTYINHNIMNDQVVRMTSPIPNGILYHDPAVVPADYNIKAARKILVDAGLAKGLTPTSSDLSWYNLAETDPIATFNYTYNVENRVRGDLGLLVKVNLKLVGIALDLVGLTWPEYLDSLSGEFDKLQLYMIGWCADYNDPSNFINPLFSNTSLSNAAQVNDLTLQTDMMTALSITDPEARRAKYSEIQHYIVEDLMPWVFLYTSISKASWSVHLGNFPRNAMGKRYFYPCTWYSTVTTPPTTTSSGFIPGYSFLALLGAAAVTISVLLYKRRR